jgi:hypothetical protein
MARIARKKVIPKKRGRPATGKDPMMALRMPPDLKAEVETWAKGKMPRSKAIRELIRLGLESAKKRGAK